MRPRGIPSKWVKVLPWYYTRRDEPSRADELRAALAVEAEADHRVSHYGATHGCPICEAAAARLGGYAQPHGRHIAPKACSCPTETSEP